MKKVLCIRSSSLGTGLATGLDQEKVRASRGGLGDATQGAGTTIIPRLSHTSFFFIYVYIYISIYNTIGGSSRASRVVGRA